MVFKNYIICAAIICVFVLGTLPGLSYAQDTGSSVGRLPEVFKASVRVADTGVLMSGRYKITLWGAELVDGMPALLRAKSRMVMDKIIDDEKVVCEVKAQKSSNISARCANADGDDLALLLIQRGYMVASRAEVYGSNYEDLYLKAEAQAQGQESGLWDQSQYGGGGGDASGATWVFAIGITIVVATIAAMALLSMVIMRGFQSVVDAQNQGIEIAGRERELKAQERHIVAKMLNSELKANKSKIEAYLIVYEEMLVVLNDPHRKPSYKQAGDLIQKQPALDRSVFDRNTDKLDVLGDELSSQVVHFYARVKSRPDYTHLEPDTPLPEAVELISGSVANAKKLGKQIDRVLDSFSRSGIDTAEYREDEDYLE